MALAAAIYIVISKTKKIKRTFGRDQILGKKSTRGLVNSLKKDEILAGNIESRRENIIPIFQRALTTELNFGSAF